MEMEMIAEGYFDYLATRSLFQEFQRDEEGIVKRCKMHDIVHDFALFLNKKECATVEVEGVEEPLLLINTCQEKLRHLMLVLGYEAPSLVSIFNAIKLRSLILFYWIPNLDAMLPVLKGIFDQLTCLRALRIEGTDNWELEEDQTNEILNGVEKLIHLRYLKLNLVGDLPEKCCELLNLQTLELENSSHFKRFPQGIGKLINLRHLIFTEDLLEYMPKGIEKLTSLRTLSEFVVASGGGRYESNIMLSAQDASSKLKESIESTRACSATTVLSGWQLITAAVVVCGMHGSCNVTNLSCFLNKFRSVCRTMINPGVLGFFVTFESILPKVNSDDIAFGGRHTSDMNLAEAKVLDIDFIAEIYDHD
ncbi:hypothetical protein WN944_023172 [Citrus x changshan-huyou]|uniref:Uncharacterized protein n=1 Tax=Citrus x changshan-huyou TaxID=2935761 RepID=A0AAP0R109_9ROSI